ncbi:hypothetical protein LTR36_000106 [Oleoguttula mirabilis]|uniref:Uncharacterized protein n=1 Tax=Oleoguttula mirabilis TaxID=1507867 RepID=A0AAV9JXV9_9PEZI|nr:hypothetical protein LTR36_000106 [Oleoguttula mirabilis]
MALQSARDGKPNAPPLLDTEEFVRNMRQTDRIEDCEYLHCGSKQMVENAIAAGREGHFEMGPVCPPCHHYAQRRAGIIRKLRNDEEADTHCAALEALTLTEDISACKNPRCDSKPQVDVDSTCTAGDPSVCDCSCPRTAATHREILDCIREIERLYRELTVGYGVERTLIEQADKDVIIDQAVPFGFSRQMLKQMAKFTGELTLNGNK